MTQRRSRCSGRACSAGRSRSPVTVSSPSNSTTWRSTNLKHRCPKPFALARLGRRPNPLQIGSWCFLTPPAIPFASRRRYPIEWTGRWPLSRRRVATPMRVEGNPARLHRRRRSERTGWRTSPTSMGASCSSPLEREQHCAIPALSFERCRCLWRHIRVSQRRLVDEPLSDWRSQ